MPQTKVQICGDLSSDSQSQSLSVSFLFGSFALLSGQRE